MIQNKVPIQKKSIPTESPGKTPTAKRSPSILVTDVRKNQTKAPFAGHKLEQQRYKDEKNKDRVSNLVKSMRRTSNSKYSNISVSKLTSDISDIPSSRQRETPRFVMTDSFGPNISSQRVPQYVKNLPSRTSKVTQKLVLIPENKLNNSIDSKEKSTTENIFQEVYNRTKAEKLTKEQRENEYPRVTAYLIAEGFNLKLTSKFLAKYHMVLPRLYDEVLYIPYSLPLLPGDNGYRVQSNTSLKMQRGIQLMENFINKSEERDYHYEFYSGADNENVEITENSRLLSTSPSNNNDFDPSEPQYFVSSSPTESMIDQEDRSNSNNSTTSTESNTSMSTDPNSNNNASSGNTDSNNSTTTNDNQNNATENIKVNQSDNTESNTEKKTEDNNKERKQSNDISNTDGNENVKHNENQNQNQNDNHHKHRYQHKKKVSNLPDLSKHAEMFILDYGVVVFWNFSEIHEKNILADLVFAKIEPGEFDDEDDESDSEGDDDLFDDDEDDEFEYDLGPPKVDNNGVKNVNKITKYDSISESVIDDENDDSDDEVNEKEELSLIIKPVPEHDIETEEFHFEYNRDVATPRIYNDMITLKSGDHLIKLTMSHAIAQSTKLSLFESKMSNVLNSISKLPKALAITGKLQNYTTKRLLTKTGRLFQLRSEVNLLSNVLDTPEYFWSIEPGLHPLYTAVREYLEIEQRVEVINDRCKVFLDFFDILSDSLAEKQMTKITKLLIVAIGLSVIVSIFEIFIRYLIISKLKS